MVVFSNSNEEIEEHVDSGRIFLNNILGCPTNNVLAFLHPCSLFFLEMGLQLSRSKCEDSFWITSYLRPVSLRKK